MYLNQEVAGLLLQASQETDSAKLLELTEKINELLEKQEQSEKAPKPECAA